ncbi:MAG: desulfoferrodoxin family protein [Clostridia bacterium]
MCENRFYICAHCGNIIGLIKDSGVPLVCCGEKMKELVANSVEASVEKHVPKVTLNDSKVLVEIGEVPHPMEEKHHIEWVYLQTDKGGQRKCLCVGGKPELSFALCDEKPIAVFAYCNIHGLWVKEL